MNNSTENDKMQVSQIIEEYCCGQGLPPGMTLADFLEKAKKLERENKELWQAIEEMRKEAS